LSNRAGFDRRVYAALETGPGSVPVPRARTGGGSLDTILGLYRLQEKIDGGLEKGLRYKGVRFKVKKMMPSLLPYILHPKPDIRI